MTSRRRFLEAAGVSALALASVACKRRMVKPPDCPHWHNPGPIRVVDAHCHVFNATDLQVAGFIDQVVLEQPEASPLRFIGDAVQWLGWNFAPTAKDELRWLSKRVRASSPPLRALRGTATSSALPALVAEVGADSDERYRAFLQEFRESRPVQWESFIAEYERVQRLRMDAATIAPFDLRAAATEALASVDALNALVAREIDLGLVPIFSYLKPYFRFRIENAWSAMQVFGCDTSPGVDLLCTALVDFDLLLGDPSHDQGRARSHLDTQIALSGEIARATQDRVRAYAPFNPLRAACDPSYLDLAERALREHRCLGFKLYPAMGFAPWNNTAYADPARLRCVAGKVDGTALDHALAALYALCAEHGAVLIAHGAPSNGAAPGAELLGSPSHWREALQAHPDIFGGDDPRVRLCLGHFGGDGDVSGPDASWYRDVIALMREHRAVYTDLSYQERILQGAAGERFIVERLIEAIAAPGVGERMLYGSDWIMLGLESRWPRYLQRFADALARDPRLAPFRDRMLGGGAREFLALPP